MLEGVMSPSVTFDPSTSSIQRDATRSSPLSGSRLLNRLTGIRNSESEGGPSPTGPSEAEEAKPGVTRAHPSASSGDLLETLPDIELRHKQQKEAEKKTPIKLIPSRIVMDLLMNTRKAQSPYAAEEPQPPQLDILA
jgi:hypothetical protein